MFHFCFISFIRFQIRGNQKWETLSTRFTSLAKISTLFSDSSDFLITAICGTWDHHGWNMFSSITRQVPVVSFSDQVKWHPGTQQMDIKQSSTRLSRLIAGWSFSKAQPGPSPGSPILGKGGIESPLGRLCHGYGSIEKLQARSQHQPNISPMASRSLCNNKKSHQTAHSEPVSVILGMN